MKMILPCLALLSTLLSLTFTTSTFESESWCSAGFFSKGETASITCRFPKDINQHDGVHIGFSSSTGAALDVLTCTRGKLAQSDCKAEDGFVFKRTDTRFLTVEVPNVTKAFEGIYVCQFVPLDNTILQKCILGVLEDSGHNVKEAADVTLPKEKNCCSTNDLQVVLLRQVMALLISLLVFGVINLCLNIANAVFSLQQNKGRSLIQALLKHLLGNIKTEKSYDSPKTTKISEIMHSPEVAPDWISQAKVHFQSNLQKITHERRTGEAGGMRNKSLQGPPQNEGRMLQGPKSSESDSDSS